MTTLVERLHQLSKARWDQEAWERETTVRIPAEPERDIDLVLARAADEIDRLTAEVERLRERNDQLNAAVSLEKSNRETMEAEIEALRARLDFVLSNCAWVRSERNDAGAIVYWLETQDEDENFIMLSGDGRFFPSREAAIDAALKETT